MPKKHRGFTLIELMVTVIVIGILAAIAIPSYQRYVLRGNRAVAKSTLLSIASMQEAYLGDRKTYALSLSALNYPGDPSYVNPSSNLSPASITSAIYSIAMTATATSYTVTATPINNQSGDTDCNVLSVTNTGIKSATGTSPSQCW